MNLLTSVLTISERVINECRLSVFKEFGIGFNWPRICAHCKLHFSHSETGSQFTLTFTVAFQINLDLLIELVLIQTVFHFIASLYCSMLPLVERILNKTTASRYFQSEELVVFTVIC